MRSAIAAAAALVLVPLAQATGTRPSLPNCADEYKPFVSKGCFADADSNSLVQRSGQDQQKMTIELCTAECKSNGFRYAGLKYYGVCYCGSFLDSEELDDAQCNQPCTGDKSQICGSDDNLSVWEDPTFSAVPADVEVSDYEDLGCHTDDSHIGRTLSYPMSIPADSFTPSACIAACKSQGFAYAGVEYASECWCGTYLPDDASKVDQSQCSLACKGDASLQCGGDARLNVYYAEELVSSEPCGYEPEPPETTTTSTAATTTSSTSTTTTTAPATTTSSTTTTKTPPTTTTSGALCTATVTKPAECEWQCGHWCAPALPDWNNPSDCHGAAKSCALQVASCFKTAGWPAALKCFDFANWCGDINDYCSKDCRGPLCGKGDCWEKRRPNGGKPPVTTTSVYPCPATTTMATTTRAPVTTSTACPPEPTNICTQPTNDRYGYGPGKPVGGIELGIVTCNDIKVDFGRNPFKLYNNEDTRRCPSFPSPQLPSVCADVCKAQYEQCTDTYVNSCGNVSWKGSFSGRSSHRRHRHRSDDEGINAELARRTWGSWSGYADASASWGGSHHGSPDSDDYSHCAVSDSSREWCRPGSDDVQCWGRGGNHPSAATTRCKAQYKDCLAVNKRVNAGGACKSYCEK